MLAAHNISAFGVENARTDTLENFGVTSGLGLTTVRFIKSIGYYMTELDGAPVRIKLGATLAESKRTIKHLAPKLVSSDELAGDVTLDGEPDALCITLDAYGVAREPDNRLTASQQKRFDLLLASELRARGSFSQVSEWTESSVAN